jgi:GNAT superfamily N-acetyltransferase
MIEVRRATAKDAKVVASLVDRLLVELGDGKVGPSDRTEVAASVLSVERGVFCYLAHQREEGVGVILANEGMAMYAGGAFGQITELYVKPGHRSAGVAAWLIREVAAMGRAQGWHRIDVGAPHQPEWSRSLHFYLSLGFVEVGPRLRLDL